MWVSLKSTFCQYQLHGASDKTQIKQIKHIFEFLKVPVYLYTWLFQVNFISMLVRPLMEGLITGNILPGLTYDELTDPPEG